MFDTVVFPFHDWKKCQSQGVMRRDTQIIRGLADHDGTRRVLLVDRPVSSSMLLYNALRNIRSFAQGGRLVSRTGTRWLRQVSSKLFVLDTLVLEPLSSLLMRRRWWPYISSNRSFLQGVQVAASQLGMSNPVLWLFTPLAAPAIGKFNESLVVFDALDNWLQHDHMSAYRDAARRGYDALRVSADVAFCNSEEMQQYLSGGKARSHWVPNGVDTSLFKPLPFLEPTYVSDAVRPKAGYVGVIDSRVDTGLLEQCARALPDVDLVLVGPVLGGGGEVARLRVLPNVHLLGPKPYEDMPRYINSFDVCLIPHKVNGYTRGMNPLKLYEYLACAKPVVTTPVAGVEIFAEVINIAATPEDYVGAIRESLSGDKGRSADARRESVVSHSWADRLAFMCNEVEARLVSTGARAPGACIVPQFGGGE